jgi:hypothetical protein
VLVLQSGWMRPGALEDEDLVSRKSLLGEPVHRASPRSFRDLGVLEPSTVHAAAAEQHPTFAREHSLEHPLEIVVALGRLLSARAAPTASAIKKTESCVAGSFFCSASASRSAL